MSLIERERLSFSRLYPNAHLGITSGTSRPAVSALFAAQCDLAVITRELEPEERQAAIRGGLELEGYRFARDAVIMIVHPNNAVENVALDDVRRIYRGEMTRWSRLGGNDAPLTPVVQSPGSDIAQYFVQQVMGGETPRARSLTESSDSAVVERVKRDPNAIGYVSLLWLDRGAKALRLASLTGLPYWKADLEAIYKGDYPLTRYFNFYVRANGPPLANGFITFVTSFDGQKLVHDQGLVPTSIPVRFVRRSPMQSTHH